MINPTPAAWPDRGKLFQSCGSAHSEKQRIAANRRAVTIVDAEELGGTMMKKLTELFDENAASAWARAATERAPLLA